MKVENGLEEVVVGLFQNKLLKIDHNFPSESGNLPVPIRHRWKKGFLLWAPNFGGNVQKILKL